jgi:Pyrrolysine biosynthesis protein PylD, N-terminal domain
MARGWGKGRTIVTRLTEDDIRWLPDGLAGLDRRLERATGLGLVGIAARACDMQPEEAAERLSDVPVAAVPISAGQGFISGFSESVASVCRYAGCHAWVTPHPDVAGLGEAADAGARLVFAADEERFIALDITTGTCADNGEATGRAFLAALDAAAGGLRGKKVLILGLGPVGRTASAPPPPPPPPPTPTVRVSSRSHASWACDRSISPWASPAALWSSMRLPWATSSLRTGSLPKASCRPPASRRRPVPRRPQPSATATYTSHWPWASLPWPSRRCCSRGRATAAVDAVRG